MPALSKGFCVLLYPMRVAHLPAVFVSLGATCCWCTTGSRDWLTQRFKDPNPRWVQVVWELWCWCMVLYTIQPHPLPSLFCK